MSSDDSEQKGLDSWTYNDVKSADFLVLRNSTTNFVEDVISPNGLQVGLLDDSFNAALFSAYLATHFALFTSLAFIDSLAIILFF